MTNKKRFWKYVNERTKTRYAIPDLEVKNDGITRIVSSDKEKAELFLEFFTSVLTREPIDNLPVLGPPITNDKLSTVNITIEDVALKLGKLNADKSPGPDRITLES